MPPIISTKLNSNHALILEYLFTFHGEFLMVTRWKLLKGAHEIE
ncbi:hypothetical protein I3842_16G109100 [Carya illinoinensis]|uniref:Uncharacterized protein n=1 Tax=Carya illinoinensis TaxID=32201 RepID=A0A922A938_CARIL|nr:hypothetical protein I3842_16G109100 [Carya illinoinensis]